MFAAKVLADSRSAMTGDRLASLAVTYPRIIHAEMCRHRNQSRNSASSRAIPINRMMQNATENPFLPSVIGRNQAGMSADSLLNDEEYDEAIEVIQEILDLTAERVARLASIGVHKQTANRYLEAFQFHTEIISATTWSNFFALRISPFAQPEIQQIAKLMKEALDASTPKTLSWREWHLPLVDDEELEKLGVENAKKVSLARVSRVSYNRHNTVKDLEDDLAQYERLTTNGHWSCAEHVAVPRPGRHGNFTGFMQHRQEFPNEDDFSKVEK